MVTLVVWTFVALAAAAFVLVVAGAADSPGAEASAGVRGYVDDLRAGLRTLRSDRRRAGEPRPARTHVDDDADLDDFFAATEVQAPAYVAVEDLTDTLARARERAARGMSGLSRR